MAQAQAPDSQPPEQNATAAKRSRRDPILLLVILLLPLILLLSIYLALRSPLLERWIWPRLQPMLAEQTGFQVDLQRLWLDPLGRLEIGGLQVRQAHPDCATFELTLDSLELRFSALKLFKKNILIDLLAVRNLSASGCLVTERTKTKSAATTPSTANTDPLKDILALLDNPSHGILLRKLLLENLQLDLQIRDTENRLQLAWQGQLDLETSFYWLEGHIQGQLQAQLVSHQPLQLTDDNLQLRVKPQVYTALAWQVQPQSGQWQAQLTLQELQIDLTDLWLQQGDAATAQLTLELPAWQLLMNGEFSSLLPRQQGNGRLRLPWQLNLAENCLLTLQAHTALELDLNRHLLEGHIDITNMNRPQMLQLLDLIDPDQLDPQINNLRSALKACSTQPLQVQALPLSPILERFGESALALPASLPLQ